ncbi:Fpg/Nei family DNA glycosylase [Phytoactinopolyspora alkaliphila]|uniref:Fpg/Nei family DNA glycosylase n=1 Tax=Phytoactinopolyspora alkaliphila TaxID=1783498 RepID=A0A6N9YPF3_9ACTN|nr:Fpg/Nei family DNA glycosylase [Phytoactinopolyspora alkaliphila]NED96926.1 Fpg/Nei family DNA glycosylase [Phytoactinopolyspora alkaliphila]
MPELPDVEGFRRVLRRAAGHPVEAVDVSDAGVLRDASTADFRRSLTGLAFGTPRRLGKWLVAPMHAPGRRHRTDEPSVVFHFGMTGELLWCPGEPDSRHPHDRVVFVTGAGELCFRDLRKLQGLRLAHEDAACDEILAGTGPDAEAIGLEDFRGRLGATRRQVKTALMDQSTVAGLGNLLVDEILWRARLHPTTPTRALADDDWRHLHRRMRSTVRAAIPTGRVPPRSSWLTGRRDQDGSTCPRCGTPVRRTRVGGRATVWCPRCQPS